MSAKKTVHQALIRAADYGHSDLLDQLLRRASPPADILKEALTSALKNTLPGHETCVKKLVPWADWEGVRDHLAKRRQWEALDRLTAHVPASLATDWCAKHKRLPQALVRLRSEAAHTETPAEPRRRQLRS